MKPEPTHELAVLLHQLLLEVKPRDRHLIVLGLVEPIRIRVLGRRQRGVLLAKLLKPRFSQDFPAVRPLEN